MSDHNPVEITGNIIVHHPIKKQAEVISLAEYVATGLGFELVKAA